MSELDLSAPVRIFRAHRFSDRLFGVWRRPLQEHEGLWLLPCRGVHTFGLPAALDVLFLDRRGKLLRLLPSLPPNRWAWHRQAYSVLELPGGYCRRHPGFPHALSQALCKAEKASRN